MLDQQTFSSAFRRRRTWIKGALMAAGAGLTGLAGSRDAMACHGYVSPLDGATGCEARNRDLENGGSTPSNTTSELPSEPNCPPEQPPPPPQGVSDPRLPYGGDYVGCHIFAGGVGNTSYSSMVAHRFACEYTGDVQKIRWWNIVRYLGYYKGNGGRIQVEIQTVDTRGLPSGEILGRTGVISRPLTIGDFPLVPFLSPIRLVAGRTYCIVYRQLASSEGWVSVNNLHCMVPCAQTSMYAPWSQTLATLRRNGNDWYDERRAKPIFELHYSDGRIKGQGWIQGGRGFKARVAGSQQARQYLNVESTRTAVELMFAITREGSAGDLTIRFAEEGRALEELSVPASRISLSKADSNQVSWVRLELSSRPRMTVGRTYTLTFSAPSGSSYHVVPIQDGGTHGWTEDKLLPNGWRGGARYSTNNGSSWYDWPVSYGVRRSNAWDIPAIIRLA